MIFTLIKLFFLKPVRGGLTIHPNSISFFIFILMFLFHGTHARAFNIPERLDYDISYSGIPAGRATQEVTQSGKEIHIVSTARSADWLKLFFPVDDRIESILIKGAPPQFIGVPKLYREKIREGWTRRHKEANFDRELMTVKTRDFLKNTETSHKITKRTFDTLSSFFYFRTIPLQVGTSNFIDIFDAKRLWNTEVQVLRRETIKTALGTFKTIVIKPLLKSEGIFARTDDMHIWLTDDERRIPVQMKSKVKIGSITATLVGGSYWQEKK